MNQINLKTLLRYDQDSGIFTWTKNSKIAGTENLGYIIIRIKGKAYRAHRLAWLYVYGKFPSKDIDHINRIKSDNRIVNLREATKSENLKNRDFCERGFKIGKGVDYHKKSNRWHARITVNKKQKYLGSFLSEEEAIVERKKAESFYSAN